MKQKVLLKIVKEALEKDDFDTLDTMLSEFYSQDHSGQDIEKIEDILTEVTLFCELKETDYKEKALELLAKT